MSEFYAFDYKNKFIIFFVQKLNKIKEEYEEKFNQLSGSNYVLRVAHNSLETRLKSSEQRRDVAEREAEAQKTQMVN